MDTKVRANKLTNAYPRDTFLGSKTLGRATGELKGSAAIIGLAAGAPILYTGIFVIKQAAPIFQAVILMFIDENRLNCTLENIECITMAENAVLNKARFSSYPVELRPTIRLQVQIAMKRSERAKD